MTKSTKDEIMRLAAPSNYITTEEFVELSHLLYDEKSCNSCKWYGLNIEDWKKGHCPMHTIDNQDTEYCWKWENL